ncbi:AAA family ATPase [Pseudomonas sp. 24 R 17]|uniref:AAA family ATPase n=1 Tax=Pseudomonas sp. 24 R 17 TaxID=1844096 RepID=UPI0008122AC1|nr:AAA family ATPase [Pseudomonas sp. 24 R 17]CRM39035.1 chromosome segregation protein [Pseudomonas sp. 24 R 17]
MYIQRVQVDEGFLDGLDITFTSGLNAIIGSRGTGKTSLIELIRFCLDVTSTTTETTRRSKDHALSILGSGQVTVTLFDDDKTILVSRTATDETPRATSVYRKPVIFSQTEIETVGLEAAGRLRLLDGFVRAKQDSDVVERDVIVECRSLTRQIESCRKEIDELEEAQKALPHLHVELTKTAQAEQEVSKTSSDLHAKTQLLSERSNDISGISVILQHVMRLKDSVALWSHEVKKGIDFALPSDIDADLAAKVTTNILDINKRIKGVRERLSNELTEVITIYHELDEIVKKYTADKVIQEDVARQLRVEVEGIQAGSGAVLRKGQELREKIAKLDSITAYLGQRKIFIQGLIDKRAAALDQLDEIRASRYKARYEASDALNKLVGPSIRVSVFRNGQVKKFAASISEALRGSGLRYAEVAESLANNLSPRALLEAVDDFDAHTIADAANITEERAARLLSHLKGCDLGEICTINIEDEVSLQLLDGTDYKDISDLSTGQRCTVVLPLILSHMNRMLIVDQPEDHIDNAFIAKTLIKVIVSRGGQGQIIFSTHNPNIPVLGNADMVLHLGSDGRRGFRISSGPLHEREIVSAISTVMEGGAEAFSKRATFYSGNS